MGQAFYPWSTFWLLPKCIQDLACCQTAVFKHAQFLFVNTCVNVTTDGRHHLGAAIGSTAYVSQYVSCKINGWVQELQLLSSFAITQPHTAYSAFTHDMGWSVNGYSLLVQYLILKISFNLLRNV